MANQPMDLPSSSYKVLRLIVIGYLHQGGSERKPATYDEVSKATSVSPTMVSGNNKALAALGILERSSGRGSYRLTEEGYELARALEFEEPQLTRRALRPLMEGNPKISQALNALRAQGQMTVDKFATHLLIVTEAKNTKMNMTGARTVIEMLVAAGMVEQSEDQLRAIREDAPVESAIGGPTRDEDEPSPNGEPGEGVEDLAVGRSATRFSVQVDVTLSADDLLDDERFSEVLEKLARLREA